MDFSTIASELNTERRTSKHPGFKRNKRGLLQKTMRAMLSLRTAEGIKPLGNGYVCYADQDPREDRPEAELIRSHVWRQEQVGELWAFINGKTFPLASVCPSGSRNLNRGFITQGGQSVVIDL